MDFLSLSDSFLLIDRILCPFPLLCTGILSGLNFCMTYACCHSLHGLICASALLCLEYTISLESSTTSLSAFIPKLLGEECDKDNTFSVEYSNYCPVEGFFVNYHLLQQEASLKKKKERKKEASLMRVP